MRKIEQAMLGAIAEGTDWCSGNTRVSCFGRYAEVYLHGNLIATIAKNGDVSPLLSVIATWPTTTTKSRLKALGVNVYTKNFTTYVDNVAIN